jgi:hypothetical protein
MSGKFDATFTQLKSLFAPYVDRLQTSADTESNFMLDGVFVSEFKRPMFFGGVRRGKAYVSFYLMPMYSNPELLGKISDDLRRRMQGKSCFNFTRVEPELFAELEQLVHAGFACYERLQYVK